MVSDALELKLPVVVSPLKRVLETTLVLWKSRKWSHFSSSSICQSVRILGSCLELNRYFIIYYLDSQQGLL